MSSINNDDLQHKINGLLELVTNRSRGKANDDLIENAVSSLLTNAVGNVESKGNTNTGSAGGRASTNQQQEQEEIVQDEGEYDDLEEDVKEVNKDEDTSAKDSVTNTENNKGALQGKVRTRSQAKAQQEPKWTGPKVTIESIEEQESELDQKVIRNNEAQGKIDFSEKWNKLDNIPLGRTGGKMMVTFGDNIETDPSACAAALVGTRQCLQNAIKDARALRRKMKIEYNRAKVMVNLHKAKRKERSVLKEESEAPHSLNVDPNMLFKAISGYDKIGYEPKCGFDDTQLEKLFPEEMNAYQKWRNMHKAYTDSKDDESKISKQQEKMANGDSDDEQENDLSSSTAKKDKEWGGHLNDRLAQFDARTDRMKEAWYMAFSVVRQGSFLSRSFTSEDRQWEKTRKEKGRGKGKRNSTWETLPAAYVQFLHWVGFDHRSALPPPNEETTEALAFLGYDFMGKIVEKAIFLRCVEKLQERRGNDDKNSDIILELEGGEQLCKNDIDRALNDSTVGVKPLYCAQDSVIENGNAVQLYFGPGFEDRIEMELEQ